MKRRCHSPTHKQFKDYGARGIFVCDEWRSDYLFFHKWALASGWKKGITIERIDNNKGYSPQNCCFIPKGKQPRNRRSCIWLEAFGKRQILADWARETKINHTTLKSRLQMGWTTEDALSVPPKMGGWAHRTAFRREGITRHV